MQKVMIGVVLVGLISLSACGVKAPAQSTQTPAQGDAKKAASEALPADLMLKEAPAGAKNVLDLKKEAKEGDEVVLRGRIGGSVEPFIDGRAAMQVADTSMIPCDQKPGDTCEAPWDLCCEEKSTIAAGSVMVQIAGADGKPLKVAMKGLNGLDPNSVIVVKGKVGKKDGDNLIVNASGIFIEEKPKAKPKG
jgi:hypothetical protein